MTTTDDAVTCESCGGLVQRRRTGRPRRYCGDVCRVRAYRQRLAAAEAERLRAEEEHRQAQLAESWPERKAALWRPMADAVYAARAAADGLLHLWPGFPTGGPIGPAELVVRLAIWRKAAAALSATADDYTRAVTQASALANGPAGTPAAQTSRPMTG